jgi:RNA polymerase sigma-70 factor (ECF subfamily)
MAEEARVHATAIVASLSGGAALPEATAEELFSLVYGELRRLAERFMREERREHTLQATALVHEAYLKLIDQTRVNWRGRTHFFAVAARVMRRVLIDYARGHAREKRGAGWQRITLADTLEPSRSPDLSIEEILSLSAALDKLARLDERQARIVELRFFAGLTVPEVADALDVSTRTVEGDWMHARAWLRRELSSGGKP